MLVNIKSLVMRRVQKLIFVAFLLLANSFNSAQSIQSEFSHIEIIVDSASFEKLVANEFIWSELANCLYDTMLVSPLVLSYYLYGQSNFIHFNPNRGYFATQKGTAYLIFQTRRPGQGKLLEERWRKVATDSIVSYDFEGPGFTLTEIVYNHHDHLSKKQTNNLVPMLSSYSVETYREWGFGDSVEVSMEQFLSQDSINKNKLFERIISIDLVITQKELQDLIPVLQLAGYQKEKNKFIKSNEPTISYVVNDNLNISKVEKLTFSLTEDAGKKSFNFGTIILIINKKRAEFSF
ncbi:MAG: hypothetical protein IPM56_12920 [Ignavibacteriales bacterium]|nr:MAG: hypothetical protein IPM56_12920 [Ignavibacteriales bacterium]